MDAFVQGQVQTGLEEGRPCTNPSVQCPLIRNHRHRRPFFSFVLVPIDLYMSKYSRCGPLCRRADQIPSNTIWMTFSYLSQCMGGQHDTLAFDVTLDRSAIV